MAWVYTFVQHSLEGIGHPYLGPQRQGGTRQNTGHTLADVGWRLYNAASHDQGGWQDLTCFRLPDAQTQGGALPLPKVSADQ